MVSLLLERWKTPCSTQRFKVASVIDSPAFGTVTPAPRKTPDEIVKLLNSCLSLQAQKVKKYNGDIDKVDLMVGMYAEDLPEGFGFSETAFRIFILMASRRLKSDRFLSKDYRPEVYTKQGIDWVEQTSMIDVITRHFPSLAFAMKGLDNAFKPWKAK